MNAQVPLRRALLVATGTYGDPGLAGLEAPQSDVEALAEVLGDGSIGQFEVQELVDRPTDEIKRAIEGFFAIARPDELLLLYFSGHGVLSQSRRFFFATSTTVLQYLRTTAIEDSFVNGAMHESRAKSIVLILDCCHSGAFGRGMTPKSALTVDVQHRFQGRGRVTLSASTELQYAFEEADPATGINELGRPPPGSVFTSCLVNGLRTGEADTNEDGEISVDELYDYACQRVRQRSPHQTPGMAGDVRGDILIAHSTRRPALAPVLVQTIDSPLAGLREGAVTELERLVRSGPPPLAEVARQALERLADDDSRRVAAAAAAALEGSPRTAPDPPTVVIAPPEPPPPARRRVLGRPRVLAGGAVAGLAAAAAAAVLLLGGSEPLPYDFDGDGAQEVVLAAESAAGADRETASGVVLVHREPGSGTAPRPIGGADLGLPVPPDADYGFGAAVASADFDADGNADLAVSASRIRGIVVLYGSRDGLPGATGTILQSDLVDPPRAQLGTFGDRLIAQRINDDEYADLVVGTPATPKERSEEGLPGAVHVLFGGDEGLAASEATSLRPPAGAEPGFGGRLAVGDIDGDHDADVVEGVPARPGVPGHASHCPGSSEGPRNCEPLQDGEWPTSALDVARVDDDELADIVQGDAGASGESGAVRVWWGSEEGPREPTTIVTPGAAPGDGFGYDVEAADLDDDGEAEIVAGAPGRPAVDVFDATRSGRVEWSGRKPRLDADSEQPWGSALSILNVDGDSWPDLVVGQYRAKSLDDAVVVFRGGEDGLAAGVPLDVPDDVARVPRQSELRLGR